MPRRLAIAGALLVSATACQQGSSERPEEGPRSQFADVEIYEEEPEEVVETRNNREALANAPSTERVDDIPKELQCNGTPGSVVLHRLNREEYNNTVRDLLNDDSRPAATFPADDFGDSFNNNAQALSVSPLLTEAYVDTAQQLAERALAEESSLSEDLVQCEPDKVGAENCAHESLARFLKRAFRRPLLDAEIAPYISLVLGAREEGLNFNEAIQVAVEAALLSVNFLFRVELDEDPQSDKPHRLTDYELATRLSYTLWSSLPDDKLFKAAADGELRTSKGIEEQARRMLDDPRADALLNSFAGQWLETIDIGRHNQPAEDIFPEYTADVKSAMEMETRLFMQDILTGETAFSQLLSADYTYVNSDLASFYEIEGDFDETFKRASLKGSPRRGLLTQGSILTATAAPTRTSPVRRGVFVLANLLCSPPPPPPPNVQGDLDIETEEITADMPLAQRLQLHVAKPACASCHRLMDPIGLGLENFDGIGRFRTEDQGVTIAATGELREPGQDEGEGQMFDGAIELSQLLTKDPRLARCATNKLFTYALSRLPKGDDDKCRIDALNDTFLEDDHDFRRLLERVVLTDSFRSRHGGLATISADSEAE